MLTFLFTLIVVGDLVRAAVLPGRIRARAGGWRSRPATVAALAAVALFSSVLAYIFWNQGVEQVGASVAGLFVHLMPVFGVVLAWIFLGERLAPVPCRRNCAYPDGYLDHEPAGAASGAGAGRNGLTACARRIAHDDDD